MTVVQWSPSSTFDKFDETRLGEHASILDVDFVCAHQIRLGAKTDIGILTTHLVQ
jgi:hypothetical protein